MKNLTKLTFQETIDYITTKFHTSPGGQFYDIGSLDRSRQFLEFLDNPQNKYKSIHVAGTSGKGSTCYYLAAILQVHGFKTGLSVSPHVVDIRERMQINSRLISKKQFANIFKDIVPAIIKMKSTVWGMPTYFDVVNAMAFLYFSNEKVDYAVVETGVGGRYDTTNTITRNDKLSVITQIGMDHEHILGKNIESIAAQKAGIFAFSTDAIVSYPAKNLLKDIFERESKDTRVSMRFVKPPHTNIKKGSKQSFYHDGHLFTIPSFAIYQAENANLAIETATTLAKRDEFTLNKPKISRALKQSVIPGRAEIVKREDTIFILDGAHNAQKMKAFLKSLKLFPEIEKPHWIVSIKDTKKSEFILKEISSLCGSIVFTSVSSKKSAKYLKLVSINPKSLQKQWQTISTIDSGVFQSPELAVTNAINKNHKIVIVSGSLYLVGEILSQLKTKITNN